VICDASATPQQQRANTLRALTMLRELQATPTTSTQKGLELALDWALNRIYQGIEHDPDDIARLRQAAREGSLILLPSHKSHIDYLILSYVFNEQNLPLPRIAAGDNLNFLPVGPILRRGGAFFIRRSFRGDRLYGAVVDAYVRRLIRDGSPIELFLEGTRSRSGKLLEPKFGLLNMIVDASLALPQRQVYFVPVSIGYERVIEARAYEHELRGGEKPKEDAAGLLKTPELLLHRYGRINLQVGQILTLQDTIQELGIEATSDIRPAKRRTIVTRLGNRVMDEINRVTSVTPGAVTALALLSHAERQISHGDLVGRCQHLLNVCVEVGARVSPTLLDAEGGVRSTAVGEAVQMFVDAQCVQSTVGKQRAASPDVLYRVVEGRRLALDTSKNIIVHFFAERSLVAAALGPKSEPTKRSWVKARVQRVSRLFKHEFRFRADAPFDEIFDATVAGMVAAGHLAEFAGDRVGPGVGSHGWDGARWIETYASILQSFFEGYKAASRALTPLLNGPFTEKDAVKHALTLGHEMYLAGDVQRREAISKPVLQNALLAFVDFGYIRFREGKLVLSDTFNSLRAVAEIEHWISAYVDGSHDPLDL
jgi:glycerol-3-phosphate O-acyltransferase